MAENKLDAKTRRIAQAGRPDVGKEASAYQTAEKQLLAIQAEQQRNLEMAKLSAKSDAQQNQLLSQAAEVAMASTAASDGMEAVTQQVNPATQAVLNKYGMGQPKFQRTQSRTQQITRQNVVINNNTTNETTNNIQVPPNVGGPLQGRPLQFKPGSYAENGGAGKFKLWLSQAFAKQKEESDKRERDYERREFSLTKSANKMMRKLEDIGRTMSERMDPRRIGTTLTSQLKALLFIFGIQYLANNWTNVMGTLKVIQNNLKDFAAWIGFGDKSQQDSGLVKGIKKLLTNDENESRNLSQIIKDIFYTKNEKNPDKKGVINILIEFIQDLWDDRAKALKEVMNMPSEGLFNSDALKKLGLDKAFEGTLNKLGDIFTAIVSGTKGLSKILGKNLSNDAMAKITNIGDSSGDRRIAERTYFASAGDLKGSYHDANNNTYIGDVSSTVQGKKNFGFDFDSDGNLISASAAMRTGNAIIDALKDNKETNTNVVMAGFQKVQDYLQKVKGNKERTGYIIWSPDKLETIRQYFGIKSNDPEWKRFLDETQKAGRFKYIKRRITEAEREYIGDVRRNNLTNIGGIEDKDYVYELVPFGDKRPGIKDSNGNVLGGRAHGIDIEHMNLLRHIIQRVSDYRGDKEGDELTFNLSDKNSVAAIENLIVKKKEEKAMAAARLAMANAGGNPNSYLIKQPVVKKTAEASITKLGAFQDMAEDAKFASQRLQTNFAKAYIMDAAEGTAHVIDAGTKLLTEATGIDMSTQLGQNVHEFREDQLKSENKSWQNPYNMGTGLIALIGDSYASGMAPYFKSAVKLAGGEAKVYCKVGAHISEAIEFTEKAFRDKASTIVYYIGTNDSAMDRASIKSAFSNLINKANNGSAKIYFSTLIYGQTRKMNNGKTLGQCNQVLNSVLIPLCRTNNIGILDLAQTSSNYQYWDREGIHPRNPSDYRTMAQDLVKLMQEQSVSFVPISSENMSSGQSVTGKTGSASGGMEDTISYAMDYFIKKGLTPEQAAGLVGNFIHESGLNTTIKNPYSSAFGIAQWLDYHNKKTGKSDNRKTNLIKKYGNSPTLDNELDYVWEELQTTHKIGYNKIKGSSSATEAARNAFGYYEFSAGPEAAIADMNAHSKGNVEGNKSLQQRITAANDAYAIYNKRRNNIVNVGSQVGAPGGGYSPGTYETGSGAESVGSVSSGNKSFLESLISTIAEMATHVWDYIIPEAKDTISEKLDEAGDKITQVMNRDIEPEVYTGKITSELKSYRAYQKNPGKLRPGLSEAEWKAAVKAETGDYPIDLGPIDQVAEMERQAGQKPKEAKFEPSDNMMAWAKAIQTGDFSNFYSKKPEEKMVELLASIDEKMGGTEKNTRKSAAVAGVQVQATAAGLQLQAEGNAIAASNKSSRGEKAVRKNESIKYDPTSESGLF